MSSVVGSLRVNLGLDSAQFASGAARVKKQSSAMEAGFKSLAKVAGALAGTLAAGLSFNKFISATVITEKAQAQLAAAIRSTGSAAGKSIEQLNKNAAALQKITTFGDEGINAMQGLLLTFTNIKGNEFDAATKATLNLATAMGTDLKSAALQVGKALNDPVLGMTALARSGIQFSDAQKAAVAAMMKTNNVIGAQTIILGELERQFGGSAEAARNTLGGALAALGNAWGDLFEIAGPGSDKLRAAVEGLVKTVSSPAFVGAVQGIGTGFFAAAELALKSITLLADNMDRIAAYATAAGIAFGVKFVGGLILAQGATFTLTGAMVALRTAIAATGIGLLVIAAAELAVAIMRSRDAAAQYASAIGALAGEQERLNIATETFYQNMNTSNLAAMKLQAERARDAIQAALVLAKKELEAAEAMNRLLTFNMFESNRLVEARDAVSQLSGELVGAEARISAADNAALNLERTLGTAATTASTLASLSGQINFDAATRSAANLSAQLGVSVGLGRALANAGAAKGDGGTVVFDPRDPRYDAEAARLAKTAQTMTDLAKEAEVAALAVRKTAVALDKVGGGGGGGSKGAAGKAAEGLDKAAIAAKALQAEFDRPMISAIDGVSNAFGDFLAGGLKDFGGFVKSIVGSFKQMLSQMIAMAVKNRIMIGLGFSGGGIGGAGTALAGAAGGGGPLGMLGSLGSGGGMLGGIGGVLGTIGSNFGAGFMTSVYGGLGGLTGAVSGGLSVGGLAGISTAIGAIAAPLLAVAAVFSFFKKKTKLLDSGLRVTVNGMDSLIQTFSVIQTKRFWGLSKKVRTSYQNAADEVATPLMKAIGQMQGGVIDAAAVLGISAAAFNGFAHTLQLSTRGMSDADAQKAVMDAFEGMGDAFAGMIPGLQALQKDGEGAMAAISRLAASLVAVNDAFDILGKSLYSASLSGADLASTMIDAFGGLDAMTQAVGAYWQGFYTEEERLATSTRRLTEAMAGLGFALPDSRDAFRALVEGIDTSTHEGAALYAGLLKLSGAFVEITTATETAAAAAAVTADAISNMVKSILGDLDLMPTSRAQNAARNALQINETRAMQAAAGGDTAAVQKYLTEVRAASSSDVAYREVAARVLATLTGGVAMPDPSVMAAPTFAASPVLSYAAPGSSASPSGADMATQLHLVATELAAMREENRQLGLRADRDRKTTADTLEKWERIGLPQERTA